MDDLVLCGERGELEWLIEELKKRMTLRGGDVLPSADHDEQEPIRFLKRRHFFTKAGIVIRKLYGLEARKPRTTPDINGAVYDAKELDEKGKYKFRSAMRALLYLSQDRVTPEPVHGRANGVSWRWSQAFDPLPQRNT